jgi:hypothetical protein
MKKTCFLVCLIFSFHLTAQESAKITPPVIVAKIALGETSVFEDTAITFLKILQDSRCPSDVNCVWAGEAEVLAIIENPQGTIETSSPPNTEYKSLYTTKYL